MIMKGYQMTKLSRTTLFCAILISLLCTISESFLSGNCEDALLTFVKVIKTECSFSLITAISNPSACIRAPIEQSKPLECLNVYSVLETTLPFLPSVQPPKPLVNMSFSRGCSLCNNISANAYHTELNALNQSCQIALSGVIAALNGKISDVNDMLSSISVSPSLLIATSLMVYGNCSNQNDYSILSALRYQSEILCASSIPFGGHITEVGTIDGVFDTRNIFQCGTCGMMSCLPGQYCPGNAAAITCPKGHYCPNPAVMFVCPANHYCPGGTVKAIPCRSMAAGSCNSEGNRREVVWIPLFISLILATLLLSATIIHVSKENEKNIQSSSQRLKRISDSSSKSFEHNVSINNKYSYSNINLSGPVSIAFKNLNLVSGSAIRLNNVTGSIPAGMFTAIIGTY
jgi:hypothetical protein